LEASAYLRKLHQILVFSEVCDGNMEEGNFRCDVNVSVRPVGQVELGTRCELKNLNSFRFVEAAIEYEVARQIALIEGGGNVVQETRGWDSAAGKTFTMRRKEEAHDYRYFPEPDLPPLVLADGFVEGVRKRMPELPERKRARFVADYGLSDYDASVLTSAKELSAYFERTVEAAAPAKAAANWITTELLRELKEVGGDLAKNPVTPAALASLLKLVEKNTISGKIAKKVFEEMFRSGGGDPETIVRERGLVQVLDSGAVEAWVDEVLAKHPAALAEYQGGNAKIHGFFVGEIMKLSRGKANPGLVNEVLKKKTGV
jgi:aspartyl-tRNA(Asn)/glutamyl-tRNA(Gln) amidotransferase subunit B